MKKILTLQKQQALVLYNLMQKPKFDSALNRMRWKFLEVIENDVFEYERLNKKLGRGYSDKLSPDDLELLEDKARELGKETIEFIFNDREVFLNGKLIFENIGKESTLEGQVGKIYKQVEDAFMDVRDIEKS